MHNIYILKSSRHILNSYAFTLKFTSNKDNAKAGSDTSRNEIILQEQENKSKEGY